MPTPATGHASLPHSFESQTPIGTMMKSYLEAPHRISKGAPCMCPPDTEYVQLIPRVLGVRYRTITSPFFLQTWQLSQRIGCVLRNDEGV